MQQIALIFGYLALNTLSMVPAESIGRSYDSEPSISGISIGPLGSLSPQRHIEEQVVGKVIGLAIDFSMIYYLVDADTQESRCIAIRQRILDHVSDAAVAIVHNHKKCPCASELIHSAVKAAVKDISAHSVKLDHDEISRSVTLRSFSVTPVIVSSHAGDAEIQAGLVSVERYVKQHLEDLYLQKSILITRPGVKAHTSTGYSVHGFLL